MPLDAAGAHLAADLAPLQCPGECLPLLRSAVPKGVAARIEHLWDMVDALCRFREAQYQVIGAQA
jgi:hypothetical protein